MVITRLVLRNWRNFRDADISLREIVYILGANASGKSNLLDALRFLRDIAKPQGGGLQKAVAERDGIQKLRCLHARKQPDVRIEVYCADNFDSNTNEWRYGLAFRPEGKGRHRVIITEESVWHGDKKLLQRPDEYDGEDNERLTETHLEQVQANRQFRELTEFFARITYLHLVPQLLKYGDRIGGNRLENDPFGQGFLELVARTPDKIRASRLQRIERALKAVVPQFEELQFVSDGITGRPHLRARYVHHRPNAGWQGEEQFSDGTLRLIALLWSLLESGSLLLLEEPELSLNSAIVQGIPQLIHEVLRKNRRRGQVLITTHSEAMLENAGIDGRGVLLIEPAPEGSIIRPVNDRERQALQSGLSVAQVVLPRTRPPTAEQFALQFLG
jgi:predicted ATPase